MKANLGDNRRARTQRAHHTNPRQNAQLQLSQARLSAAARERQRLARDLHDGVQNELVSLMVELAVAEHDSDTPPVLSAKLSALGARAQATLDAIREIAHGDRPPLLAAAGVIEAIRAQAALAPITVNPIGTAPRSSNDAEEAAYFACLEALQNVAKHAGRSARVTLRLLYRDGTLAVRVADDGGGFDRVRVREGAGLTNIRDRITSVGGTVNITSTVGRGTVVAIALPWPGRQTALAQDRALSRDDGRGHASLNPLRGRPARRRQQAPAPITTPTRFSPLGRWIAKRLG
jgi:signal transduction histidine kinase